MAAPGATSSTRSEDDCLVDDYLTVPGQQYVLISVVAPEGTNQKNEHFGIKIRGCFASKDEAGRHAKRLQETDRLMDIYIADMYKWLLIPPDPNAVADQEYQDEKLNQIIRGHMDNQRKAKELYEIRKEDVKRDGIDKHLSPEERLPRPPVVAGSEEHAKLFADDDPRAKRLNEEKAAGDEASGSGS